MKSWVNLFLKADARLSMGLLVSDDKKFTSTILKFFSHSGDSWFWLAGLFFVWLLSEGEWRRRTVFLGIGLAFMAIIVIIIKFTIRRPRPEGEWGQIYRITDPHSFPSGHAARSAALAVLGLATGPTWFGILLALWAPWVGLSRVALGVHYLSDVIAGWLIGIILGLIALALEPWIMSFLGFLL
ncbi:MAG: phosphatase PAP2 family protein [Anaerolineales bacterium]